MLLPKPARSLTSIQQGMRSISHTFMGIFPLNCCICTMAITQCTGLLLHCYKTPSRRALQHTFDFKDTSITYLINKSRPVETTSWMCWLKTEGAEHPIFSLFVGFFYSEEQWEVSRVFSIEFIFFSSKSIQTPQHISTSVISDIQRHLHFSQHPTLPVCEWNSLLQLKTQFQKVGKGIPITF